MLFQNIVKRKKIGSRCLEGIGVETASLNGEDALPAAHTAVPTPLPATICGSPVEML
jgi:hypothetical protein